MALEPQLILLDEPMAGMISEEKEGLARYVVDLNEEFGMTVVMIEHDMGVVMDISHRMMVLGLRPQDRRGRSRLVLADPMSSALIWVKRTKCWSIPTTCPRPRRPRHDGLRRPRRPSRHLSKTAAASTPKSMVPRSRCVKRILACGACSPGTITRRAYMTCARHDRAWAWQGRRDRHHRRQPAGLGVGGNRHPCRRRNELGLYRDVLDEEAAYLLSYGEARLVFAEDEEQVDKLLASPIACRI